MVKTVTIGSYALFADDSEPPGRKVLENGRNYERHIVAELERLIPSSIGFADIGCNVGIHTVIAKSINPALPVVCADASPQNIDFLIRTIVYNRLEDVTVLPFALSDQTGILRTNKYFPNLCCLKSKHYDASFPRLAPCFALDDLRLPPIDLVKIDVEGFEIFVLEGASEIMKSRPRIIFEFCPEVVNRSDVSPEGFLKWFLERGYELTVLDYAQTGQRKTCSTEREVLDHLAAASKCITDILAESVA